MKKIILLALLFISINSFAQVTDYYIIKYNQNQFDKDLQSYTGWKEWIEESHTKFSISNNAAKKTLTYFGYNEDSKTSSSYSEITVYSFISDEPNEKYPFRKKLNIKHTIINYDGSKPEKNYKIETLGTGYIYSETQLDKILEGNAKTEIYVYCDMTDANKGYYGYKINKYSTNELEQMKVAQDEMREAQEEKEIEAQEEAKELKRKKLEQTNNNIKVIGKSLQILLKK